MNRFFISKFIFVFIIGGMIGGCEKPNPIDLVDPLSNQDRVIVQAPTQSKLLNTDDIDSAKLFAPTEITAWGQLLIEGSEYDSPTEHHQASLARAIFYNSSVPVVIGRDTAYKTLNVGSVNIDNLQLAQVQKHFGSPGGTIDTALGIQYFLFNQDSLGGNGFTFDGGRQYQWKCSGTPSVAAFNFGVTAPQALHVVTPTERSIVRLSGSLFVRWSGGADTVRVYVREMNNGVPGKMSLPGLVTANHGSILIPKDYLAGLPRDRSDFLFTFASSQTTHANISGFNGDVVVQTVTTHNIVLQVKP